MLEADEDAKQESSDGEDAIITTKHHRKQRNRANTKVGVLEPVPSELRKTQTNYNNKAYALDDILD